MVGMREHKLVDRSWIFNSRQGAEISAGRWNMTLRVCPVEKKKVNKKRLK